MVAMEMELDSLEGVVVAMEMELDSLEGVVNVIKEVGGEWGIRWLKGT